VNLIGEHIDYEGYSVLPMAIRQDMIVAIRKADGGQVRVANVDDKYPVCVYPADPDKVPSALLCSGPLLPARSVAIGDTICRGCDAIGVQFGR
jgi:hypothetical protein